MNVKIISAGAGSGKTYRLTSEMVELLQSGKVQASGIIATTFTKKAAAELQERVRVRLLEEGLSKEADDLANALIGTVHGLGVKLLKRFAFEAGVSPEVAIIADEDQQVMFNQSLSTVLTNEKVAEVEQLCQRLGLHKRERYDWRKIVKQLTEVARSNGFEAVVLEESKVKSYEGFTQFLAKPESSDADQWLKRAPKILSEAIQLLQDNEDETKVTQTAIKDLKNLQNELKLRGGLHWYQWVKICKLKTGAKSRDEVADLKEFAALHESQPAFHADIKDFIYQIFEIAIAAIDEYDQYKKRRGLIDYTDMEVLIKDLLKNESVQEVLRDELDLLMVDEFQDTSPMQLEIFLKLSELANESVWVGDPKQSIYGFRGAEPKLMQAIIQKMGGVKPENVQMYSWRSREDVVNLTNSIFSKAFDLPEEQVALLPKRQKKVSETSVNQEPEPEEMGEAILHWHCVPDMEGKRLPGKPWMENAIARCVKKTLERGTIVYPKEEKVYRPIRPNDIAILCRSNRECQTMAEALHKSGIRAAISRSGLLATAESKLILACLKFILDKYDSLSIAEILILAANLSIEEIIENRLEYLQQAEAKTEYLNHKWGENEPFIEQLNELRAQVVELSSTEILNLLLEELDLRRIIVSWGNADQRLANVDVLRAFALQYEEACNRLHSAASLGGFLLWLNDLESNGVDMQGSGENPDAVNVLTYHRSKGLEWPMVICHALETRLRADVWGVSLINEREEVDLQNVLGNRWLRYWVNPYADQIKGTKLLERVEESEAKKEKTQDALQEEARLMYVGITRARDYIVFPTRPKSTLWLNRVCNEGNESVPTLEASGESNWAWKETYLEKAFEEHLYPVSFTVSTMAEQAVSYIEAAKGKAVQTPYLYDLRKETLADDFRFSIKNQVSYQQPFPLEEEADPAQIAKAFKAFLTADSSTYDLADRLKMEAAIFQRFEIESDLEEKSFLKTADAFFHWINTNFSIQKMHRKYPIRFLRKERLHSTVLDLILETEEGLILIQNSSFGGEKGMDKKAKELADWLFLSKKALQEIYGQRPIRTMVHFVLQGKIFEVEVREVQLALF